jgi:hypothetical protein
VAAILLVFILATIGVKVLLAVVAIYCLLPSDHRCAACDAETLPLLPRRGLAAAYGLLRLQKRWCPGCGRVDLARQGRQPRIFIGPATPETAGQPLDG